jgi:hypothetical protein
MPHLKTFAIAMIAGVVGVAIANRISALRSVIRTDS